MRGMTRLLTGATAAARVGRPTHGSQPRHGLALQAAVENVAAFISPTEPRTVHKSVRKLRCALFE